MPRFAVPVLAFVDADSLESAQSKVSDALSVHAFSADPIACVLDEKLDGFAVSDPNQVLSALDHSVRGNSSSRERHQSDVSGQARHSSDDAGLTPSQRLESSEGSAAAGISLDRIYSAWHAIGADLAGLEWSKFAHLLAASPASVPAQQAPVSEQGRRDARIARQERAMADVSPGGAAS